MDPGERHAVNMATTVNPRTIAGSSISSETHRTTIVGRDRLEYPGDNAVFDRAGLAQLRRVARLVFRGRHVANRFEHAGG